MRETIGHVEVDGRRYPIEFEADGLAIHVGEQVAVLQGDRRGSTWSLVHTEVPPPLRGKGIAEALARAALDRARAEGLSVNPACPFVKRFIDRHAQYKDLVESSS